MKISNYKGNSIGKNEFIPVTKEELDKAILAIPIPNLTNYATKEYVQELINAIEMPEGAAGMIALTEEEILAICK